MDMSTQYIAGVFPTSPKEAPGRQAQLVTELLNKLQQSRRGSLNAKFDAAQTFTANENHWSNADNFDPHTVASLTVRRKLRSRSRYELIENNPYLKGTVLTIVNDFVGGCPKLKVHDEDYSERQRKEIQDKFWEWVEVVQLRNKLWRMRMAKIVDGEAFMIPFINRNRLINNPVLLDLHVVECDRVSSHDITQPSSDQVNEIDGVRFDPYEQPLDYFVLNQHPGGSFFLHPRVSNDNGKWIKAKHVIHWFRQDRGWLRGIPELTPSLPLCALLRRYTLATVRNMEVITDMTVLLESEFPANRTPYTDGAGRPLNDDPFDLFPLEMGMAMNLPWGMTAKQLQGVPSGVDYDQFTGSLLREILRPICVPYNIGSGSSKDSNMASGVLDQTIYEGAQTSERIDCEPRVLSRIFRWWYDEAKLIPGYLTKKKANPDRSDYLPKHSFGWDDIGIDHTDPDKVSKALETMHKNRFITDADIQEKRFNRPVDEWHKQCLEDDKRRAKLKTTELAPPKDPNQPKAVPGSGAKKPAAKPKTAKAHESNGHSRITQV